MLLKLGRSGAGQDKTAQWIGLPIIYSQNCKHPTAIHCMSIDANRVRHGMAHSFILFQDLMCSKICQRKGLQACIEFLPAVHLIHAVLRITKLDTSAHIAALA